MSGHISQFWVGFEYRSLALLKSQNGAHLTLQAQSKCQPQDFLRNLHTCTTMLDNMRLVLPYVTKYGSNEFPMTRIAHQFLSTKILPWWLYASGLGSIPTPEITLQQQRGLRLT
jgi:hypothetical protein